MNNADPLRVVDSLQSHGLRVVVIGGHAVNAHGYMRTTEDVDCLLVKTDGWPTRLLEALQELHGFYITDEVDPRTGLEQTRPVDAGYLASRQLLMVGTDVGYLDLFLFVPNCPDLSAETIWETAVTIAGRRFANLAILRRLKAAAGRPRDLEDLKNLP